MMTNTNKSIPMTADEACAAAGEIAAKVAPILGWYTVPNADQSWGYDRSHTLSQAAIPSRVAPEARLVPTITLCAIPYGADRGKRIEIHVSWPRDAQGRTFQPSGDSSAWRMTVSASKSPAEIARDINRRLMTRYLSEYARQATLAREWDAEADTSKAIAERLYVAMGSGAAPWSTNGGTAHRTHDAEGAIAVEVRGEQVHLEIRDLTEAEAMKVIALVKGMRVALKLA